MFRIFVGIVVISFLSDRATSQWPKCLMDIPKVFNFTMIEYQNAVHSKDTNKMREHVEKILQELVESSHELDVFDTDWKINCNDVVNYLLDGRLIRISLQSPTKELCDHINKVDRIFQKSWQYEIGTSFGNASFQSFAHEALWGDINISDSLEDIYELFSLGTFGSGLLSLAHQHRKENPEDDCDTYVSAQQQIYYFYLQLIISELKGMLSIQRIYLTKRLINESPDDFIAELGYANETFQKRVDEYYQKCTRHMDLFPQHIHRCDIKQLERGVNVIELKKLSRFTPFNPEVKNGNNACTECSSLSTIEKISPATKKFIYNCTKLGSTVTFCPAESGSYRDYLWWQDEDGTRYGNYTTCDSQRVVHSRQKPENIWNRFFNPTKCQVCACSIDQNEIQTEEGFTTWRISITDQVSDLQNNMVVTGVRFITYDNALHLQIRQTNFSPNEEAHNNTSWKELDIGSGIEDSPPTKMNMSYLPFRHNRKSLWLDDIRVPEGRVVIGVRFQPAGDSAFKLQILATPFDFETGLRIPFGEVWIDAATNPMRPEDYNQKRIKLNLNNSDDPTKATHFKYDEESNKLVKFTHTDIYKDAGQTTIPLLDARSVETHPPFPLGGIGLSYRGSDGFSGYIAPRIYTMNIEKYMRSLNSSPNSQDLTTEGPTESEQDNILSHY